MEWHAHHRQSCHPGDATQAPIRSNSNPIRSQRSVAERPGRRTGDRIDRGASHPKIIGSSGRVVTREETDRGAAFSDAQSVKAYVRG